MELIKSSLSFFTTIPIQGDIEKLRRNLWIFPYAGIFVGSVIAGVLYLLTILNLKFLGILAYLLVEGINHIDGLADFGDAFFAPRDKKVQALKDTRIGAGGVVFVVIYIAIIYQALLTADFLKVVVAQSLAKFGMLIAMVTSKPSWSGMASYMMEFARKRDLVIGFIALIPFLILSPIRTLKLLIASIILVFVLKFYSESRFGGISGDILGVLNCSVFALCLIS